MLVIVIALLEMVIPVPVFTSILRPFCVSPMPADTDTLESDQRNCPELSTERRYPAVAPPLVPVSNLEAVSELSLTIDEIDKPNIVFCVINSIVSLLLKEEVRPLDAKFTSDKLP